ncbi:Uncharacterised protein [Sphingobacterium multivorum]|jgi:hypothetical protein|nr:Uncharacterised protein [Sphingobacterium multivorum]
MLLVKSHNLIIIFGYRIFLILLLIRAMVAHNQKNKARI